MNHREMALCSKVISLVESPAQVPVRAAPPPRSVAAFRPTDLVNEIVITYRNPGAGPCPRGSASPNLPRSPRRFYSSRPGMPFPLEAGNATISKAGCGIGTSHAAILKPGLLNLYQSRGW